MRLFEDEIKTDFVLAPKRVGNGIIPVVLDVSNIAKYLWIGRADKTWYEEVEEVIVELFGREQLLPFAKILAATSIHSTLRSNLSQARRAKFQLESGIEIKGYLPNVQKQLELLRDGKGLSGRKIRNFANAIAGDKEAVVVDIWILRAFGQDRKYVRTRTGTPLSAGANEKQYNAIEKWIKKNAEQMGLQPRQLCAMIWSGVRQCATGKNNTTRYQELLVAQYKSQHKLDF